MGVASLGFTNGPSMTFRIDPTSIEYNYQVQTSVTNTVGGRVIQVLGAVLSDVVISGDIGEDHSLGRAPAGDPEHPGVSWKLAEAFFSKIQSMMLHQSKDATTAPNAGQQTVLTPAVFVYSPLGLRFQCYIKSIVDAADGTASVAHKVGRSNYQYTLTLFPVVDSNNSSDTTGLVKAGFSNGALDAAKASAIDAYINRISQGIGWKFTAYNGGSTPSSPYTGK